MQRKEISKSVLKRLPGYLDYLKNMPENSPVHISATALANALGMGEVQVRKDLALVSSGGKLLTLGNLMTFMLLSRSFNMPISQISNQINSIVMAMAGAERIFELMDEPEEEDNGYVTLVNAKEDLLTQALGITPERRSQWCRPVSPRFLEAVNKAKPTTMDGFAEIWYRHSGGDSSNWRVCALHHYDHSRYHLLNLHATFSTERPAHTIEFRAFNGTLDADRIIAYIQLCLAISAQALHTKAASPTRPVTDNPKYAFRCWLLKLGFIGDEFKTAREVLIKLLPGNSAWRQAS